MTTSSATPTLDYQDPHTRLPDQRERGKKARGAIAIVLIISLILAAGARQWAETLRLTATTAGGQAVAGSRQSLSSMPSFALALLLGGLRGPLVMILWTSSESQKADKDLEDFDTKVEWIRLLQPEFDTVHMFQIWNKAYNVSVQMASQANKYAAILDALDYAKSVDKERPNDINITFEIGRVYFDKLGNSQEREYYRKRVQDETKWRVMPARREGWRRTKLDPMLDTSGNLLTTATTEGQRPAAEELDSLKKYQPFPYGLSPIAISLPYYYRSERLQKQGQRHLQVSMSVVDSRPALALKFWNEEEWMQARRLEFAAFGKQSQLPPPDVEHRINLENPTENIALDTKAVDPAALAEAIYRYELASRLAGDSGAEYRRHLEDEDYKVNYITYKEAMDHVQGVEQFMKADFAYLKAMTVSGDQRKQLLDEAAAAYKAAIRLFSRQELRYYVDASVVSQLKYDTAAVDMLSDERMASLLSQVKAMVHSGGNAVQDPNGETRTEYELYRTRAAARLAQIQAALMGRKPATTGQ
jgi:hypothetical protein